MPKSDDVKKAMRGKKKKNKAWSGRDLLSTGSTLLNLACSNSAEGGFAKGRYYFLVGDSASGKTWLSMTCLAEATLNPHFVDYQFIYDPVEGGAMMDVIKYFGHTVADKIKAPSGGTSSTIEEFYFNVDDALSDDQPCIYILDSMDALVSSEDNAKFYERKAAHDNGKEVAGSYGTSKAKANSAGIRQLIPKLEKTGSILIIISQTRDNIGFGFEKKTRSGGHALRFYATLEAWSSVKGKLKKTVRGKPRQIGITCQVQIKKNRLTGQEHVVEFPIYWSVGIDDIGSCISYLIDEGRWSKDKTGFITAPELDSRLRIEDLVSHIENEGLEQDLCEIVAEVWAEVQEACSVKRKRRYE